MPRVETQTAPISRPFSFAMTIFLCRSSLLSSGLCFLLFCCCCCFCHCSLDRNKNSQKARFLPELFPAVPRPAGYPSRTCTGGVRVSSDCYSAEFKLWAFLSTLLRQTSSSLSGEQSLTAILIWVFSPLGFHRHSRSSSDGAYVFPLHFLQTSWQPACPRRLEMSFDSCPVLHCKLPPSIYDRTQFLRIQSQHVEWTKLGKGWYFPSYKNPVAIISVAHRKLLHTRKINCPSTSA